jgi:predicted ArsR family transcriptional regulator
MLAPQLEARFLDGTRERIVTLLWRAGHTVPELAAALGIGGNTVRAHLAALQRNGLVQQHGARRGAGKPAAVYTLTPAAERLFPSAYARLLHSLLEVSSQRLGTAELDDLLRSAGRRLAVQLAPARPAPDLPGRVEQAVAVLAELGGAPQLEQRDGAFLIQSNRCPAVAVVRAHPPLCGLMEALLSDVASADVRQQCVREGERWCVFAVQGRSRQGEAPPPASS